MSSWKAVEGAARRGGLEQIIEPFEDLLEGAEALAVSARRLTVSRPG